MTTSTLSLDGFFSPPSPTQIYTPPSSLWVPDPSIIEAAPLVKRDIRLRPYQEEGIQTILDYYECGKNRIVAELPTGAGKTILALMLLRRILTESEHALLLVPSILLAKQTTTVARSIFSHREVGRYQGEYHEVGRKITVATVATLRDPERRAELQASILGRRFSTIIVDEAHGAITESCMQIVEALLHPYGLLLGMTGTPWRQDGRSLQRLFTSLSEPAFYVDVLDLIAQGYLVRPEALKLDTDLNLDDMEVEIENEEHRQGEKPLSRKLMKRLYTSNRYAQAYHAWANILERDRTLFFADSVPDAYAFRNYVMERNGICDIIKGSTPDEQREEILTLLNQGTLPIVSNFNVLTVGVDMPRVRGAIIGRFSFMGENPNTALHQQVIGRLLRPSDIPGHKPNALVVYLTCKRYPNVPQVMSMGLLPGSLEDSRRKYHALPRLPSEEEQGKEALETPEEEQPEAFSLRLKRLKLEITDLFCGEGWIKHFDQSFSKETRLGKLVAEREGALDTYSIFLERDGRRHRITEQPCPVKDALARGIQYVQRKEIEARMRRGDHSSDEAKLPLTDEQKAYLSKRKAMSLPKQGKKIDFSQMTQGIYFQIEALLRQRDTMPGTPIVIWKPGKAPRLWTPPTK